MHDAGRDLEANAEWNEINIRKFENLLAHAIVVPHVHAGVEYTYIAISIYGRRSEEHTVEGSSDCSSETWFASLATFCCATYI